MSVVSKFTTTTRWCFHTLCTQHTALLSLALPSSSFDIPTKVPTKAPSNAAKRSPFRFHPHRHPCQHPHPHPRYRPKDPSVHHLSVALPQRPSVRQPTPLPPLNTTVGDVAGLHSTTNYGIPARWWLARWHGILARWQHAGTRQCYFFITDLLYLLCTQL